MTEREIIELLTALAATGCIDGKVYVRSDPDDEAVEPRLRVRAVDVTPAPVAHEEDD